ncbi:MAG: metallophosphoesterase [Betaproteobacteria bacterium]|nr:metallophosphoesterase [Betaproteobacteria bacterium]
MRIALFADVHANLQALEACRADAARRGRDREAFLGDLVGYGADAAAVVDLAMAAVQDGAVSVRGNHDDAIDGESGYLNEMARAGVAHARATLNETQRAHLKHLPLIVRSAEACFVHGSADAPERFRYLDGIDAAKRCAAAAEAPITFVGHVHEQRLYFATLGERMHLLTPTPGIAIPVPRHRRCVAVVGSVGQPRDRNPMAAYALYDATRRTLTFHRVSYDHRAAAQRIRAAGLPESIAYRVEHGI